MAKKYDESTVTTLGSLEHIRLRSGMYIGRLGTGSQSHDGIYVMLKEVIDNSVDEFIMGFGSRIDISVNDDNLVCVRDHGRGIPFGKLIDCASVINTGAKYNTDVFQFSVGLNGVGIKAVNALSSHFLIRSVRKKKFVEALFVRGVLQKEGSGSCKTLDGTYVEFRPDDTIFPPYSFSQSLIREALLRYSFLNPKLELMFGKERFYSEQGLYDYVVHTLGGEGNYEICHKKTKQLEFAFTHTDQYGETVSSFVNGQYTSDGGTHQNAFREGLLRGVNDFFKTTYISSDLKEGLVAALSVRIQDPIFESQTKNKLGNTDIRPWILQETRTAVQDFFLQNQAARDELQSILQRNEKLRKELSQLRKKVRGAAKKFSITIGNLRDCKYHRGHQKHGEETTLFITEGQSAAGSIVNARNVYTQAVFALRGKPKNMVAKKPTDIYHVEELYNLVVALGIEQDTDQLRYERIVIATDADHDGYHIRNLLLTFFIRYYEGLVVSGHISILETPIFRVRNKKEQVYCYTEQEKTEALRSIQHAEITRFKGLGEISPQEFRSFIGEDIRLLPVELSQIGAMKDTLLFYMGNNTPKRRHFIMEHLTDAEL